MEKGYWTPERLEALRRLLDTVAVPDPQGKGVLLSVEKHVRLLVLDIGPQFDLYVGTTQAKQGLDILFFLGVLLPRRYYNPGHPPITDADVARYWLARWERRVFSVPRRRNLRRP